MTSVPSQAHGCDDPVGCDDAAGYGDPVGCDDLMACNAKSDWAQTLHWIGADVTREVEKEVIVWCQEKT